MRESDASKEKEETMDYEKIGKVIYELRTERRLTQKQLADELNISDKTVSKWERGVSHS